MRHFKQARLDANKVLKLDDSNKDALKLLASIDGLKERALRKDKKLVFIDCETYNLCLNFCHNVSWQVSMIKTDGTKKLDEKDYYIKWDTDFKISEDAARITRYDEDYVNKNGNGDSNN